MSLILLTACASKPTVSVVGECAWTEYFILTDDNITDLVACCPDVARSILVHNDMRVRYCGSFPRHQRIDNE